MAGTTKTQDPKTLLEAVRYFSDKDVAWDFFRRYRWPNGDPVCPHCGGTEHTFIKTRKIWRCKSCRQQFSIKVGTTFEDSPLGLDKWLPAMWLLANAKNSVSSHELARALGVTQKTAWFMFHRIRAAMAEAHTRKFSGTVEADETYIGGEAKNMHKSIRRLRIGGYAGTDHKTAVQGARERESGTVRGATVKGTMRAHVEEWVEHGSNVFTDEAKYHQRLGDAYAHKHVTHSNYYVSGIVHTNGIENFWSLLKRSIKGTQVHVDPRHLDRYVTERAFAYNNRLANDLGRMGMATRGTDGRRVTWNELTAK